MHVKMWVVHTAGESVASATVKAKALIGQFLATQAFIKAVDDVFLLAGAVLLVGVVPLLIVRTNRARVRHPGLKPINAKDE